MITSLIGILAAANMGASGPPPGDPFFADVIALSEFDAPVDEGPAARSMRLTTLTTSNSYGARSSDAHSKFGTHSLELNTASSGAVEYGDPNAIPALRFDASNFCIEFWYRHDAEPTSQGFWFGNWVTSGNQRSIRCGYEPSTNRVEVMVSTTGADIIIGAFDCDTDGVSVATLFDGNWHHIAFRRNGADLDVYVDGIKGSVTGAVGASALFRRAAAFYYFVGASSTTLSFTSPGVLLPGNMSEFRLTIGVPRYTGSSFTPPTTIFGRNVTDDPDFASVVLLTSFDKEFGLHYYGNKTPTLQFRSDSSPGDMSVDGMRIQPNTSIIRYNQSGAWGLGSEDFTIEIFAYRPSGLATNRILLASWNSVNGERGWYIGTGTALNQDFCFVYSTDGISATQLGNHNLNTNTTYDLCVEREGTDLNFYIDGILVGTSTLSGAIPDISTVNTSLIFGASGDETARGFAASSSVTKAFRITQGVARYGGTNYTVPTLPLPKE